MKPLARFFVFPGFLFFLAACAGTPQTDALLANIPREFLAPIEITQTPFFSQLDYQCGPAALATILAGAGAVVSPVDLAPQVFLPRRKGSLQIELVAAARRHDRIPYLIDTELAALFTAIKMGYPVLVLQNLGTGWIPFWHYAVVIGYDLVQNRVTLRSGQNFRHQIPLELFERTWQRGGHWGMIVVEVGEMPAFLEPDAYFHAASGLEQLRRYPLAIQAYRAGLDRWPGHTGLRMGMANSVYETGEKGKAMQQFLDLVNDEPEYAPAHNNLAQLYYESGQLDKALGHAEKAVALGGRHIVNYRHTLSAIQAAFRNKN